MLFIFVICDLYLISLYTNKSNCVLARIIYFYNIVEVGAVAQLFFDESESDQMILCIVKHTVFNIYSRIRYNIFILIVIFCHLKMTTILSVFLEGL